MRFNPLASMRMQTAIIIVVGLTLSHFAGFFLYSLDRRGAVEITEALDIADRAAGVSRLLRDFPAGLRDDIVRFSDSRAFRVWISETTPIGDADLTKDEIDIVAYLRAQIPRISDNEMRVQYGPVDQKSVTPPDRITDLAVALPSETSTSLGGKIVVISINHPDGTWLNFLSATNTPKSFLPEFLGANIFSAVFAIALVAFWLVHRVTDPLTRLANAAERLGKNIRTAPLSESGPREVAKAASAFNRMQHRLAQLVENRTELLAAISHDLRTPITQMKLRTEFMPPSLEREKNLLALDEMEKIIGTFLDFARAAQDSEERSRIDLGTLVESICLDHADSGADITYEGEDGLVLSCKRLAVKRALSNLIDNALKYGQRARVEAHRVGPNIVVRIDDDGPGIPEENIEAVFMPFNRGDTSRNTHTGGVGLGLSIAQTVCEDHGGIVRLTNRAQGGLKAEMSLPT